jgi:hypothetical protein
VHEGLGLNPIPSTAKERKRKKKTKTICPRELNDWEREA